MDSPWRALAAERRGSASPGIRTRSGADARVPRGAEEPGHAAPERSSQATEAPPPPKSDPPAARESRGDKSPPPPAPAPRSGNDRKSGRAGGVSRAQASATGAANRRTAECARTRGRRSPRLPEGRATRSGPPALRLPENCMPVFTPSFRSTFTALAAAGLLISSAASAAPPGFAFLEIPTGARAAALGGAYSLARRRGRGVVLESGRARATRGLQITGAHVEWFETLRHDQFARRRRGCSAAASRPRCARCTPSRSTSATSSAT